MIDEPTRYKRPEKIFPVTCWKMVGDASGKNRGVADLDASPDALFDRRWAHAILHHALEELQESMKNGQDAGLFHELQPYLEFRSNEEESYSSLASRLGLTVTALKSKVRRMRQAYRKILFDQISMTLEEGEDPKQELTALLGAMISV
jgi:hypothetical protein